MNTKFKNLIHFIICVSITLSIVYVVFDQYEKVAGDWFAVYLRPIWLILGLIIEVIVIFLYVASVWYYRRTKKILVKDMISNPVNAPIWELLREAKKGTQTRRKYEAAPSSEERNLAHGIIFGVQPDDRLYISPEEEPYHVLVVGGTRSGKTSAVLIPTLRVWQHTAFVIDISGDISCMTYRDDKIVLDIMGGEQYYNIFCYADAAKNRTELWAQLEILANCLMPSEKANDTERFFRDEGRRLLLASLVYLYDKGCDFCQFCREFTRVDAQSLISDILEDTSADPRILAIMQSMQGTNSKNIQGCKQNADSCIEKFAYDEHIKKSIHRGTNAITPEILEQKSVFVNIPQYLLDVYSPLLSIISQQVMYYFKMREVTPQTKTCLMCLDEFPQLGMIPNINNALMTLAKKKVRLMLCVQSDASLNRIYGNDTRIEMLTNCGYKCILNATDPETQETYSRLIGERNVERQSVTAGNGNPSYTYSLQKERIIEPAELAYLQNHLILLTPTGYIRLTKNFYFKENAHYVPEMVPFDESKYAK